MRTSQATAVLSLVPEVLLVLALAGLVVSFYMLVRNQRVYSFRMGLIDRIFAFPDSSWRIARFDEVSYNDMMLNPLKPLKPEKWWSDTSFLEPKQ